jgi:hypothetical protein
MLRYFPRLIALHDDGSLGFLPAANRRRNIATALKCNCDAGRLKSSKDWADTARISDEP